MDDELAVGELDGLRGLRRLLRRLREEAQESVAAGHAARALQLREVALHLELGIDHHARFGKRGAKEDFGLRLERLLLVAKADRVDGDERELQCRDRRREEHGGARET